MLRAFAVARGLEAVLPTAHFARVGALTKCNLVADRISTATRAAGGFYACFVIATIMYLVPVLATKCNTVLPMECYGRYLDK